jgi:hypothetical protein
MIVVARKRVMDDLFVLCNERPCGDPGGLRLFAAAVLLLQSLEQR